MDLSGGSGAICWPPYPARRLVSRGQATAGFPGLDQLFEGRHFDREIIVLCVRWYLRFKLSFRDLVQMMAERGLSMAHTTIVRWVHHYVPEFERRWNRFARPVGRSWRVDETYVKIRGKWVYLYRGWIVRERPWASASVLSAMLVRPKRSFARQSKVRDRPRGPSHWTVMRHRTAPHRAQDESGRSNADRYEAAFIEVSEQPHRAGSPRCEGTHRSDARV
jgi:hypothetical protein